MDATECTVIQTSLASAMGQNCHPVTVGGSSMCCVLRPSYGLLHFRTERRFYTTPTYLISLCGWQLNLVVWWLRQVCTFSLCSLRVILIFCYPTTTLLQALDLALFRTAWLVRLVLLGNFSHSSSTNNEQIRQGEHNLEPDNLRRV